MEYHVHYGRPIRSPGAIETAILAIDPAATVAIEPAAGRLRVSSWFNLADLLLLLHASGHPARDSQVTELPSVCCGGCGG